jgi:hypothetical protein
MHPTYKELEAVQLWKDRERQFRKEGALRALQPLPALPPSRASRMLARLGRLLVALGTQLQRYDTVQRPL